MNLTVNGIGLIIKSGALISVLIMLPNVVWMLMPKAAVGAHPSEPLLLTILENMGRFATLLLPFFFSLDMHKKFSTPVVVGMGLALAVYYACWIRYFAGGRTAALLGAPFLGIPVPLAIAPIVFLILSSYLMSSWWMLGAALLFGVAHIWISALTL
jgi:hypothetical protein